MFWWLEAPEQLSKRSFEAVAAVDAEVFVSIASLWEMANKVGLGKWPEARQLVADFETEMAREGFLVLPISLAHVRAAGLMQSPHRDPFDRLLAAQAMIEGLTLVTADPKAGALGAAVLW